ncbi:TetR family transcriptional regulator [Nakamurella sp. YIM 132087]|uniref:TetR family transcriptional regulator n=2 Tax=Nakamurella alba TaxID=2665158 RepID=A0A7K1FJB7_9ACTN|nr:TetR family transcriptional regulator [Nakamurella alba]
MARPVRQSSRKAQLIEASSRLFQEFGYHNVSMDDLATAVGVTGPALYRHFRNKHDLLAQALTGQLVLIEGVVRQAADLDGGPQEKFEAFLSGMGALVVEVDEALLWKRERRHLTGDDQQDFRHRLREVGRVTAGIVRGVRPELDDADIRLLSWCLLAIFASSREYRSAIEAARVVASLQAMARAVVGVELTARDAPGDAEGREDDADPPRRPAGRRERILEAAIRLFDTRGYYAVTIEDIAEAADAAIATVYQYFSSKAELLQAALERGIEGAHYLTWHRLSGAPTDALALEILIDSYVELALGPHRRLLGILAADLIYLPAPVQHTIRKSEREYVEEWVVALSALRPELGPAEARAFSQTTISLINEVVQIPALRARPGIGADLRALAHAAIFA